MIHQCRFTDPSVDPYVGASDIWEISIFSAQCFCEPKIDLKSKVYFLKNK